MHCVKGNQTCEHDHCRNNPTESFKNHSSRNRPQEVPSIRLEDSYCSTSYEVHLRRCSLFASSSRQTNLVMFTREVAQIDLKLVSSAALPSINFFYSLPTPDPNDRVWGFYDLMMEKPNCPAKLYIGSSTKDKYEVRSRMRQYELGNQVPRLVQSALKKRHTIEHKSCCDLVCCRGSCHGNNKRSEE